jgi:exodeoxyribonuclease VII large subunit
VIDKVNSESQSLDLKYSSLEKSHPQNAINLKKVKLQNTLVELKHQIKNAMESKASQFDSQKTQLLHSQFPFKLYQSKLKNSSQKLENLLHTHFENIKHHYETLVSQLNTLSPLSTLSRGYSITFDETHKKVITSNKQVREGDQVETQTADGHFSSKVVSIKNPSK